jgi:hypothetical protein
MSTYVFTFAGGARPQGEQELAGVMSAWQSWFSTLGAAVKQPGDPFGSAVTVSADGIARPGSAGDLGGYSVITADSLDAAAGLAKGCPILEHGGRVEIYEVVPM